MIQDFFFRSFLLDIEQKTSSNPTKKFQNLNKQEKKRIKKNHRVWITKLIMNRLHKGSVKLEKQDHFFLPFSCIPHFYISFFLAADSKIDY